MPEDFEVFIARLIAEPQLLLAKFEDVRSALEAGGMIISGWGEAQEGSFVSEFGVTGETGLTPASAIRLRAILDAHFAPSDLLVTCGKPRVPKLFVSDMDSTMIAAECIDELADYAGIKPQIAEITERAMRGELDFVSALRERVALLKGLPESAIARCLKERIAMMPGARVLVETLKAQGCRTVLVTGGFHQFADPVAQMLGFERVVANRLEIVDGRLTGALVGSITDSGVKRAVLLEEMALLGDDAVSLATGDGANDVPMLEAASYGVAFCAKPVARAAADGWVDQGDLTRVLTLLGIAREQWLWD